MKQVPMYNSPALRSSRLLPVVLRTGCCSLALSAAMLLAAPQAEAGVAGTARKVAVKVIKGAPKTRGGMVDDAAEIVAGKLGRSLSVAEKVSDGLADATKKMDPTPVFRDISRPLGIGITLVFGLVVIYLCGLVYKLLRSLLKPLRSRKQPFPDTPPGPLPSSVPTPAEPAAATATPPRHPIDREEVLCAEADNSAHPSGVKQAAAPLPCGSSDGSGRKSNPEEIVIPEV